MEESKNPNDVEPFQVKDDKYILGNVNINKFRDDRKKAKKR